MEVARPLVVFALLDRRYALALTSVQRTIRAVAITALPDAPAIVLGIIDLAGSVLPVIDMRRRFHQAERDPQLSDHLIVATAGRRTVALLVDEALGVISVSPAQIVAGGDQMPCLGPIEGAVTLEDGLVLIHDLDRLLSLDEEIAIARALAAASATQTGVSAFGYSAQESAS